MLEQLGSDAGSLDLMEEQLAEFWMELFIMKQGGASLEMSSLSHLDYSMIGEIQMWWDGQLAGAGMAKKTGEYVGS